MTSGRAPRPTTALLHQAHWPVAGFDSVMPALHKASTVFFPTMAAWRAREWRSKQSFIYGPHGTPTTFELEARIAALEGGQHGLLCPSGLSAIALIYKAFLQPGDRVLVPINVYPAHRTLLVEELATWGVQVVLYDPTDVENLMADDAKLIWVEAPCSLTLEFPDVRQIAKHAQAAGALVAVDNTWGAGVAFSPFELGADVSIQALTKYANGAGDVVMGSVCTQERRLHDQVKLCAMRWGFNVSAADAHDVLRGLQTLPLRYAAHDRSARRLVEHLLDHPAIDRVLHPALPAACGHAVWKKECSAAAGLFSVVFRSEYSERDIDSFIDRLQLFRIGFSWGGPISLVLPYGRSAATLQPLSGELVRFSAGLEDVDDLVEDLRQALDHLHRRSPSHA